MISQHPQSLNLKLHSGIIRHELFESLNWAQPNFFEMLILAYELKRCWQEAVFVY